MLIRKCQNKLEMNVKISIVLSLLKMGNNDNIDSLLAVHYTLINNYNDKDNDGFVSSSIKSDFIIKQTVEIHVLYVKISSSLL